MYIIYLYVLCMYLFIYIYMHIYIPRVHDKGGASARTMQRSDVESEAISIMRLRSGGTMGWTRKLSGSCSNHFLGDSVS